MLRMIRYYRLVVFFELGFKLKKKKKKPYPF